MNTFADQSDRDAVRDATNLVDLIGEHISLARRGREFVGLCPFHDDSNPSFAVVTHKGNEFYICNACGASGDAFSFVMDYHKMDFPGALRFLADRAGVTLKPRRSSNKENGPFGSDRDGRELLLRANDFAARIFRKTLSDLPESGAVAQALSKRNVTPEMVEAFGIGAAPEGWDHLLTLIRQKNLPLDAFLHAGLLKARDRGDGHYDTFRNRLIFPICDELGRPIAFGARQVDPNDQPKYLNSPESPVFDKSKTLYGLHLAKRAIIDAERAIVTEGYTDVIACHQAGVQNVVATLGTALTARHASTLQRLCSTVVLVFDGDEAGQKAADRAVEVFFSSNIDVRICTLPGGADPDDLLKRPDGVEQFNRCVDEATDAIAFKLNRFRSALEATDGLSARQTKIEDFLRSLGALGFARLQGVRKSLVVNELAALVAMPVSTVERMLRATTSQAEQRNDRIRTSSSHDEAAQAPAIDIPAQELDSATRRRRHAEEEILALVLAEPKLRRVEVTRPDGLAAPLMSVLAPGSFVSPDLGRIAEAVFSDAVLDANLTIQGIMTELVEPQLRTVMSRLFQHGASLLEAAEPTPEERLHVAFDATQQLVDRAAYEAGLQAYRQDSASGGTAISSLEELIQTRREQQYVSGALPRVRTESP